MAWVRDAELKADGMDDTVSDLEGHVDDFDEYFANLQWEFRVFALNRVWERTVKGVPVRYDAVLGDDPEPPVSNVSESIHVSLNDLELADQMVPIKSTVIVTIADAAAAAAAAAVTAVADARAAHDGLSIPSVQITNVAISKEPKVVITHTSLTVTEEDGGDGMAQYYAVVLAKAPSATVTVTITNPDDSGLTIPDTELMFTTADWFIGQEVMVSAMNETPNDAADPGDVTLTHAATGAPEYVDVEIDDVTVSIKDDDKQPADVNGEPQQLDEGAAVTPLLSISPTAAAFATPRRCQRRPCDSNLRSPSRRTPIMF